MQCFDDQFNLLNLIKLFSLQKIFTTLANLDYNVSCDKKYEEDLILFFIRTYCFSNVHLFESYANLHTIISAKWDILLSSCAIIWDVLKHRRLPCF